MKSLYSRLRGKDRDTPNPSHTSHGGPSRRTSIISTNNNRHSVHSPSPSLTVSRPSSPSRLSPNSRSSTIHAVSTSSASSASTSSLHPSTALGLEDFDTIALRAVDKDGLGFQLESMGLEQGQQLGEGNGNVNGKHVTFRSPLPTPTPSALMDEITNGHVDEIPSSPAMNGSGGDSTGPSSSTRPNISSRQSASIPASRPPISARKQSLPPLSSIRPASFRSPSPAKWARTAQTDRSAHATTTTAQNPVSYGPTPTPSEHSYAPSTQSYLVQPNSWSEMAEEDLVANLGPRERTRQEVLWEIVSSEERYVQELIKLNDTFCRALLPPSATSPTLTLHDPLLALSRTLSPSSIGSPTSPDLGDSPVLPIAARYARSPSSPRPNVSSSSAEDTPEAGSPDQSSSTARQDAYNKLTNGRPGPGKLPPVSSSTTPKSKRSVTSIRDKARSHQSLQPSTSSGLSSPRGITESRSASSGTGVSTGTTKKTWSGSFARFSHPNPTSGTGTAAARPHPHRASSRVNSGSSLASILAAPPHPVLPEELEKVLTVLAGGILQGHLKLAAALRKRYEDQYPLVRSLADVFTAHSYILREYATYILHLEAALGIISSALLAASRPPPISSSSRRLSRHSTSHTSASSSAPTQDLHAAVQAQTAEYHLGVTLLSLEELAMERGEAGLAISLSKPFQRLLKYPLLFQNLLFNTDASLREYEKTLEMVDQVEMIVRGIEDEKVDKEEGERMRDAWARIEGLEGDQMLMAPKSDRLLVSETQLSPADSAALEMTISGRTRKSKHRLSDMLKKPEPADLWIVRFSDVSLLCDKTSSTLLPISASIKSKRESMPEMGGRGRYATMGRRSHSAAARNLYRFLKVHEWHVQQKSGGEEELTQRESTARTPPLAGRSRPSSSLAAGTTKRISSAPSQRSFVNPAVATITPRSKRTSITPTPAPSDPDTRIPSETPIRMPLKQDDGLSPAQPSIARTSRPSDVDIVSDRLSVMSFAFKDGDQVRPARVRPKVSAASSAIPAPSTVRPRPTSTAAPTTTRTAAGHVQGKAAEAKFAHRLRSAEPYPTQIQTNTHATIAAGGVSTVRPNSAARRSLPPVMVRSAMSGGVGGSSNTATVRERSAVPLSPKAGMNGVNARPDQVVVALNPESTIKGTNTSAVSTLAGPARTAGAGAGGRSGSVSSRRSAARPGIAGVTSAATVRGSAGRGGMI